jgi:hypothetical protein
MKTEDLIASLSRDARMTEPPVSRRITIAVAVAALAAFVFLMTVIGPRPDLAAASATMLFDLKMVLVATLALAAIALLRAVARPEAELPRVVLVLPVLLLVFGIGHEIATQAPANVLPRLIGRNWGTCLIAIPIMAVAPLAAILVAMTASAPQEPMRAGALAGFAAGTIAALFYALHCTDDSPLFVVTWYTIAIAAVTMAGAALGRRVLAW